jgi:hypothetical protein
MSHTAGPKTVRTEVLERQIEDSGPLVPCEHAERHTDVASVPVVEGNDYRASRQQCPTVPRIPDRLQRDRLIPVDTQPAHLPSEVGWVDEQLGQGGAGRWIREHVVHEDRNSRS